AGRVGACGERCCALHAVLEDQTMKYFAHILCVVTVGLCLGISAARASVVVAGTRVVFQARQGQATVRLMNKGDKPSLVEVWIDKSNPDATPNTVHTPFLVTPPVFRINGHSSQSIRILYIPG